MGNTFGKIYRLTTFGESHGPAIGGIIDGMPAGLKVDFDKINEFMARRRPGQSSLTTKRNETDSVEFLSGILNGVTLGTPIGFTIANTDASTGDYERLRDSFRPNHGDYTYQVKYGIRDYRGGGRASARETAARVVAGALAKLFLSREGISIYSFSSQIGEVKLPYGYNSIDISAAKDSPVYCPDAEVSVQMEKAIRNAAANNDTLGGIVSCVIKGVPAGLGEPVFDKLQAVLASAMMSIPAAKGFDYGTGFEGIGIRGSESVDSFVTLENGIITTSTNHSGGIQGGISNGNDIYFRVAFKPVATLSRPLETVDTKGNPTTLLMTGRHDACVVPRAVAVVEAMAACVIMDAFLLNRLSKL